MKMLKTLNAKGGLSRCKRPSFSVRKAAFYTPKDGLLEP